MALSGDLPERPPKSPSSNTIKECDCATCRGSRRQLAPEEAREWKCPLCNWIVRLTYDELANCGTPMCTNCGTVGIMELQD